MRLLLALCLWLLPLPVLAHAVLLGTTPSDGVILEAPPVALTLSFNEAVSPLSLRLIGPDGTETDLTDTPGGAELTIVPPDLAPGTHVLSWRVASDDGHPVTGALVFSVGIESGTAAVPAGDGAVRVWLWLVRALLLVTAAVGIGGAVFGVVAGLPQAARRPLALCCTTAAVSAPAYLGLHGLDALGLPLVAIVTPAPWAAAWATSAGPSVGAITLAAVAALAGLRYPRLALAALLLLAGGFAASGHASAAAPQALTRPLVALHLAALTFWAGALLPLVLWLRRPDGAGGGGAEARGTAALARFSAVIPVAVIVLAGSGFALAAIQLGPDPAVWPSAYGAVLAAKLALLLVLLLLAAGNRWHLTAAALRGDAGATLRLRRSILAELVLIAAILCLAAGWRLTPPPRALALVPDPAPIITHFGTDAAMADLVITPARAGPVSVEVIVYDGDMLPAAARAVTLSLAHPDLGIAAFATPMTPGADGTWVIPRLVLPQPGGWEATLEIRIDTFTQTVITTTFDIP